MSSWATPSLTRPRRSRSDTALRSGYTVGAGVEAALTDTVIGRVEYRYSDFGADKYATTPKTRAGFSSSQVLVGVGVKF